MEESIYVVKKKRKEEEKKEMEWSVDMRQPLLFSLQTGSPQAALHHHHTQQVKRLTEDNSHHACLLRLSGLRAADVQKKVKNDLV